MQNPYIHSDGLLVIPFDSDVRYHWWSGGQRPEITREEILNGDIEQVGTDILDSHSYVQPDRDVPFPGAYGVDKKMVDSRGNGQSPDMARDNLLLF